MKHLVLVILLLCTPSAFAGEPLDNLDSYQPGEMREYRVEGKDVRVCAAITEASYETLEKQCSGKFGDCIDIVDVKTLSDSASSNRQSIKADYTAVSGKSLTFNVVNKRAHTHKIRVTAYDPDYQLKDVINFLPRTTEYFQLPSNQPLYVYAGIDIKDLHFTQQHVIDHHATEQHCKEKFGCVMFEEFRVDKWVAHTSGRGMGQKLHPDSKGLVKFKITNNHEIPIKMTVYARSPDTGACNL